MTHSPPGVLQKKFRHVYSTCLNYGLDITSDRIPITPAAHYFMGGVLTDLVGRTILGGLYAAGEVASTGIHGANRLASNSLLEALVFGGRAALAMREEKTMGGRQSVAPQSPLSPGSTQKIRDITWRYAGIVRNAEELKTGLKLLSEIKDDSNLLTVARIIHRSALAREESRGAHFREDFPDKYPSKRHSSIKIGQDVRLG
jgi:L-aspartate oxidase